ncbi:NAD(P)H-quinone oxidoreductase [Sphingobacterium sp. C459-1T]|uniref:NAD(P)H-quinone oxidoreductase n=2 Tax=Sphingobacterium faecale TaxID=2803775 RepID=A0ABS1R141_9SPHI|nr:NAD(P)H-quinone oxidoreductase [Sphingobacterium faecale]MBL1408378.1 NAD(P)H-quinone oxidoreductase [Sphingobacterium faecale]
MDAVVITKSGGPDVLQVRKRMIPTIGDYEVLVEVRAAGVNRPDVFQRKGNYPAPTGVVADIPGLEVAGIIVKVGSACCGIRIGDRVMALIAGGGYAQYVAVDFRLCIVLPDNLSFIEAAGMPETLFTVWHNVFERGRLIKGERFLIHGGAGGIGSTAIQLANLLGADVFTTVGSSEKISFVQELGASHIVNYKECDFEDVWSGIGIDVILDSIGGSYFEKNVNLLSEEGRLIIINAMQGAKVELNLIKMMHKRIHLTGSTLRNRSLEFKRQLTEAICQNVLPLIETGTYKTPIAEVFSYKDAGYAHELMESRAFNGKIILAF